MEESAPVLGDSITSGIKMGSFGGDPRQIGKFIFFVNFIGFRITIETNLWACAGVGRHTLYVGGAKSWTGVPE